MFSTDIHVKAAIYYFNKWGWFFDRDRKKINELAQKQYFEMINEQTFL